MNASISRADERAELNWLKYREQKELWLGLSEETAKAQRETTGRLWLAIEKVLRSDIGASMQALAAVLMIQIEDDESNEDVPGLYRASLRAIRPQVVGLIAEAADRVLAAALAEEGA
jgi:hypothetical protein